MIANRTRRSLLALSLALVSAPAVPAAAAPNPSCSAVLGGDWTEQGDTCTTTISSVRGSEMELSVQLPSAVLSDPVAGPVARTYLRQAVDARRPDAAMMARDSTHRIDYQQFTRNALTSLVFHEFDQTVGNPPNNAYRTITFGPGRLLALRDLFTPGTDPLIALPPLVRPYLAAALDDAAPPHDPGTYPFTTDKFEPQPDGSGYANNYRAFALTSTELILYLPDKPMAHENPWPRDRFVWSMDGGTVIVRVPLTALSSILIV